MGQTVLKTSYCVPLPSQYQCRSMIILPPLGRSQLLSSAQRTSLNQLTTLTTPNSSTHTVSSITTPLLYNHILQPVILGAPVSCTTKFIMTFFFLRLCSRFVRAPTDLCSCGWFSIVASRCGILSNTHGIYFDNYQLSFLVVYGIHPVK